MPKPLNAKGIKAAKAYAAKFLENYEGILLKLADKVLADGVGSRLGSADGIKFSDHKKEKFPDGRRGCKKAEVKLHPHKDVYSEMGGTDADADVPDAIKDVRTKFPKEKFISGHVLNAEFGGSGDDPANQTVLTTGANSQHHFDESVKAAWTMMTKSWEEMYRFASGKPTAESYMAGLQKKWAIHVVGEVDSASWYDKLKSDPSVTDPYPLNCVTTQVVFTAKELNGPDEHAIADNLSIEYDRMAQLLRNLSEFREHMSQAAKFVVKQAAPASLDGRSPVTTEITDGSGTTTSRDSSAWKKTIKVSVSKGKGVPKPPKVITKTVRSFFVTSTGAEIDLISGDNEIGYATDGYPWTGTPTDLTGEPIFYIWVNKAGGAALVECEKGIKTAIAVNGKKLGNSRLSLDPDKEIWVSDSKAPDGRYHKLTYKQK